MPRETLRCVLAWSASRAKEFERCGREGWFARYASWNWWGEEPRGARYAAMVHKNLTSLPAFTGDCVHRAIARWFDVRRGGGTWGVRELFEEARRLFRKGWRESAGDGWRERPNRSVHLDDHHYGVEIERQRTERSRVLLETSARHFVEMEELAAVREGPPETWIAQESLDQFQFNGTPVYAVPDLATRREGRLHVYDWKTGRPREDDRFQLLVYALYAMARWEAAPAEISCHAVYLGEGSTVEVAPTEDQLAGARERIAASLTEMTAAHYDPDSEAPDLGRFPTTGAPQLCGTCRFRGICDAAPKN